MISDKTRNKLSTGFEKKGIHKIYFYLFTAIVLQSKPRHKIIRVGNKLALRQSLPNAGSSFHSHLNIVYDDNKPFSVESIGRVL